MRTYTVHLREGREPVLVAEGWSWGAFLFGPLWLLAQRAWIAGLIDLALFVLSFALLPRLAGPLSFGLALLAGLLGRDLVRWSLERRRYALSEVVAAPDHNSALRRLLEARTDIAGAA